MGPPDLLELVQIGPPSPQGLVDLEARLKGAIDGKVQLEIVSPAGTRANVALEAIERVRGFESR